MTPKEIDDILNASAEWGWVLEPDAKRILKLIGLNVPNFFHAQTAEEAIAFSHSIGYPVVAKVISPDIIHKSDMHGVEVGIDSDQMVRSTFLRFSTVKNFQGMLIDETIYGTELIVGAKIDYQFGPMVLLGIGGTGVEIYHDISLKMAPLTGEDVRAMLQELKGSQLLFGFRGTPPINIESLKHTLITFSNFVITIQKKIESIDLNPVICSAAGCVVADARIILKD
jgi:succinyl-CoA synthetase beta subunit